MLDYTKGKWTDVTSKLMPKVDADEVYSILKDSPAYDKPIDKDDDIALVINYVGYDKTIQFLADCKESIDGGVVVKMFKWNGESFEEFEYEFSPE